MTSKQIERVAKNRAPQERSVDAYFKRYSATFFIKRQCMLVGVGRMIRIVRKMNNSV